jgi:pimeloyl-ACP methyl ester carboxylesterase
VPIKGSVICIHGFGGNADQFRYNLPSLAEAGYKTYAVDLLGYGYSDKPSPKDYAVNSLYNFETWSDQIASFIDGVVGGPCTLVCNSIGGVVGLQSSLLRPSLVQGVVLIDISLRMLHASKQNAFQRPIVSAIQNVLRETGANESLLNLCDYLRGFELLILEMCCYRILYA